MHRCSVMVSAVSELIPMETREESSLWRMLKAVITVHLSNYALML